MMLDTFLIIALLMLLGYAFWYVADDLWLMISSFCVPYTVGDVMHGIK